MIAAGRVRFFLVLASLMAFCCTAAYAECQAPKQVRNYLKAHRSWSVVTSADLEPGDRKLWRKAHKALCPGIAVVDLQGTGQKSYALAILNKTKNGRLERLILLQAEGKKLAPKTIVSAFKIGNPLVVWRGKPGRQKEFGSNRRVEIPHPPIVFEALEASSRLFYLSDGKIRTLLVTD